MVVGQVVKNKKRYHGSSMVLDEKGQVRQAWQLQPNSSSIIVVGRDGEVLFAKDGQMTAEEVSATIRLIESKVKAF